MPSQNNAARIGQTIKGLETTTRFALAVLALASGVYTYLGVRGLLDGDANFVFFAAIIYSAAVSVGIYQGEPVLDLDYLEDSAAETDLNVVMTNAGGFIEVQGTAEGAPFQPDEFNAMLALAQKGMNEIFELQKAALVD